MGVKNVRFHLNQELIQVRPIELNRVGCEAVAHQRYYRKVVQYRAVIKFRPLDPDSLVYSLSIRERD